MHCLNNKSTFTIEYTNYAKGIAIILLLIHHFVFIPFHIPFTSGNIQELIVLFTKVCVPLFSVLSGYGITKSYMKYSQNSENKDFAFAFSHLKKLLINYWWVYIPVLLLALTIGFRGYPWEVYGTGIKGFAQFFLDFSGMRAIAYTATYCNTWWFMEVTIIFYAIFPWLYEMYKKIPYIVMAVLFIPLLYVQFFSFPKFLKSGDREVFYLFSFAVGMLLADRGILDKLIAFCIKKKLLYGFASIAFVIISAVLSVILPYIGLLLFALSIIVFVVFIKDCKLNFNKTFEFLGKYSMDVFLIHSLYLSYIEDFAEITSSKLLNKLIGFVFLVVSNFAIAVALEYVKKIVKKRGRCEKR